MPEQSHIRWQVPGTGPPVASGVGPGGRRSSSPILLPLYHCPSHVKVFSQDTELASYLRLMESANLAVRLHDTANAFLDELQQEPPIAENHLWQQRRLLDIAEDRTLVPQLLKHWQSDRPKTNLARVCVIDDMPALLPDLLDWDGHRILIASEMPDAQARDLIGEGWVHQILQRDQFGWKSQLMAKLQWQMAKPKPALQRLWSLKLSGEQIQVLRDPIIARELFTLASERWVEWACVGTPFGILGRSAVNQIEWLQLQLTSDVGRAILEAEQLDLCDAEISAIAGCRSLLDQELRLGLGLPAASSAVPAFHIGEDGSLIGAWRPVRNVNTGKQDQALLTDDFDSSPRTP